MKKGPRLADLGGIPLSVNIFAPAFGDDARSRLLASPVHYVRPGLPPFLLAYGDHDMISLPAQAVAFQETLAAKGVPARKLMVAGRDHMSILRDTVKPDDPLGTAILQFVRTGKPG